ncbi:alkaline phosphatase D family protein [Paraburkholderia phymatum]|uniref:Alkaline phosphatase D family protein n=1 Tax=Paraburkholderia phymatum TaxID=148447 RepID=A0ACC6U2D1_9BURK
MIQQRAPIGTPPVCAAFDGSHGRDVRRAGFIESAVIALGTQLSLHGREYAFTQPAGWDDHEFSDDCWQDHQVYTNAETQETQRRRNASRAWAECMPVDWGDVRFEPHNPSYTNIRIYREFRFGMLVHLVMTDERLYRDDHVVSEAAVARAHGHDPVHGRLALLCRRNGGRPR